MTENDPSLRLSMDGGMSLELTPDNTTLYTFLGHTVIGDLTVDNATINHVFHRTGQNEQGQAIGMYFFRTHPAYRDIAEHLTEYRYPMVLNQRQVPLCDFKAHCEEVDRQAAIFAGEIPDEL